MQKKGFTIVELMISIVILVILSGVGFLSYISYLPGVRDANRKAQLNSLYNVLEANKTKSVAPLPADNVRIESNSTLIGYQGYLSKDILSEIEFTKGGFDPKDKTPYVYMLDKEKKNIQLLAFLEEADKNDNVILPQDGSQSTSGFFPFTYGKSLGILLETTTYLPIQDISAIRIDGRLDIAITNEIYTAYLTNTERIVGNHNELTAILPNANCSRIKELTDIRVSGAYSINPTGDQEVEAYCDMENEGGGWVLVLKSDGNNSTFQYSADYWSTANSYQTGSYLFDKSEFKSELFNTMDFQDIMLSLVTKGKRNNLVFPYSDSSLLNVFSGGTFKEIPIVGKKNWMSLIPGSSLQSNCNKEGFNITANPSGADWVRIGFLSNDETHCSTTDSAIGIGMKPWNGGIYTGNNCEYTTCYNIAGESEANENIASFGYLFVR